MAYHRLRTLGPRHEITLLTFNEGREDPRADESLRPFCKRIIRVPLPKWRIAWNLLSRGPFSDLPLQVIYYHSQAFRAQLQSLMNEDFDLVHAFMLRLRPYIEDLPLPVVLECIDSMRLNMGRQMEATRNWRRLVYGLELQRMNQYEPAVDAYIKRTIFVSSLDAECSGSAKALSLPLGVTLPECAAVCEGAVVAFSGNMAYGPNALAVTWFVRHCWASIRGRFPNATFRILGGGVTNKVQALAAEPGVEVHGVVADMAEALLKSAVAIAPMQSGSGMQFKILEALACGLPVVATSLGRGTIAARPEEGLWVADDPEDMVRVICDLLSDHDQCRTAGRRGRAFVALNHSWDQAADTIERIWSQSIGGASGDDWPGSAADGELLGQ